jgi:hypothetical protein
MDTGHPSNVLCSMSACIPIEKQPSANNAAPKLCLKTAFATCIKKKPKKLLS